MPYRFAASFLLCGCLVLALGCESNRREVVVQEPHGVLQIAPSRWFERRLDTEDADKRWPRLSFHVSCDGVIEPKKVILKAKSCGCLNAFINGNKLDVGGEFRIGMGLDCILEIDVKGLGTSSRSVAQRLTFGFDGRDYPVDVDIAYLEPVRVEPSNLVSPFSRFADTRIPFRVEFVSEERGILEVPPVINLWPDVKAEAVLINAGSIECVGDLYRRDWSYELIFAREGLGSMLPNQRGILFDRGLRINRSSDGLNFDVRVQVAANEGIVCPSSIYLGRCKIGKTYRRTILIRAVDRDPFRIDWNVAADDNKEVEVTLNSAEAAQHLVKISFTPGSTGDFDLPIKLSTSHPITEHVELRIKGISEAHE